MNSTLFFFHMVGLALGLGTSFAMMTLGMALKDADPEERGKFMMKALVLSKNGAIGLGLLLISGLAMLGMRFELYFSAGGAAFVIKLVLVVVLIGLFGAMQMKIRQVRNEGPGSQMASIPKLGRLMLATTLLITAFAVAAFH